MKMIISLFLAVTLMLGILLFTVGCGTDGQTPYIGENGNWWVGDTDLGVPATGPKGDQGEKGEKGEQGEAGTNGYSPYVGGNGNWWIGETDLGIPVAGPKGEDGDDGEDGKTPYIGENGNWWIGDTDLGVFAGGGTTPPPSGDDDDDTVYEAKIEAVKTADHSVARTVHPGAEIKYYIIIANTGNIAGEVSVTDTVPTLTTYVDGTAANNNGTLTWNVTVPAGESVKIEYTVKVDDDLTLCDENATIEATTATIGDIEAKANVIYVERTLNPVDIKFLDTAIDSLADSTWCDFELAKWIYYVAYTMGNAMTSTNCGANFTETINRIINGITPTGTDDEKAAQIKAQTALIDMIAPTLFGGKSLRIAPDGLKGDPCESITEMDIVPGDVIIAKTDGVIDSYIYGSYGMFSLESGCIKVDTDEVLSSIMDTDIFFVLRPSISMINFTHSDPNLTPEPLTEKQKAIVETAKYYMLRGQWLQYDDVYLVYSQTDYAGNESRWQYAERAPEEYTEDLWGYINCAAFTHDVYWTVFGEKLPGGMYTTANYAGNSASNNMKVWSYTRTRNQTHTDEEKARISAEFLETLQPGDTLIVRRTLASGKTSGHAMLYIGDGIFIHSTGSSYNFNGTVGNSTGIGLEVYEPTIRFCKVQDYFLSPASTNGYIFGPNVTETCVVRVLNNSTWANKSVTQIAKDRVEYLQGVIAQKLVSVGSSVSVNPGDEITYTISINNTNNYDMTLNVTDVVPTNTTLVSAGSATVNGTNLSWNAEIPARTTVELTFTVKVNPTATRDTVIKNDGAKIAGVPFKTYDTVVKRTLTAEEQQKIVTAFNTLKQSGTSLRDIALVNEIYKEALGIENIFDVTSITTIMQDNTKGVFTNLKSDGTALPNVGGNPGYLLNTTGYYNDYLAGNLFGGRRMITGNKLTDTYNIRTRLARECNLVIGDIFVGRTSSATTIWIYLGGEYFYKITGSIAIDTITADNRLERGGGYSYYYAVLRPSYGIDK